MSVQQSDAPGDTLDTLFGNKARIEELPSDDSDSDFEDVVDEGEINGPPFPGKFAPRASTRHRDRKLPSWLRPTRVKIRNQDPVTKTTEARDKVTKECLPLLLLDNRTQELPVNRYGLPHLRRHAHASFLRNTLQPLPAPYQIADASRPWFFYWALCGLSSLGEDVSGYADRLRDTVRPLQHPEGGYGGGHGQTAHCACSYATVLALAITGGLEVVDRKAMWHWLGQVKQSDGGFRMAIGAEEDVRGAYCAMTIISLLNLPLELPNDAPARSAGLTSFVDRLGEWVGRCQTYEGGIAGAPTNEAHGGYAFCALACLSILGAPSRSIPAYINVPALIHWLALRQTDPEGGFAGRQEKLVDACYSHWVGGCWALLEAALPKSASSEPHNSPDIWNREALIRYLLCCSQQPGKKGGMRDKPSTRPDGYHTAYSLAGLSHAQNKYKYEPDKEIVAAASDRLTAAFNWKAARPTLEERDTWKVEEDDMVEFVHPVFVVPMNVVENARLQFTDAEF